MFVLVKHTFACMYVWACKRSFISIHLRLDTLMYINIFCIRVIIYAVILRGVALLFICFENMLQIFVKLTYKENFAKTKNKLLQFHLI